MPIRRVRGAIAGSATADELRQNLKVMSLVDAFAESK